MISERSVIGPTIAVVKGILSMNDEANADTHTMITIATNNCFSSGTFYIEKSINQYQLYTYMQ